MISIVATTAFFTAVTADSNQTWLSLFELETEKLDAAQPELTEVGEGTCWDLTEAGIGYNLELARFCKEVTDFELQCANEDLEGLAIAAEEGEEEEKAAEEGEEETTETVEGERRRLNENGEGDETVVEGDETAETTDEEVETISPEELAELEAEWAAVKTQVYDENIKAYGALVSCIERNRYYSSWGNTSWLKEEYATLTCTDVIAQWGDGSCDSDKSKKFAINVCCPKSCTTFEKLGCEAAKQDEEQKIAEKENEIGPKKVGEVCEGHADCGEGLQCGSEARPATTTTVAPADAPAETADVTPAPADAPADAAEETADETADAEAPVENGEGARLLENVENGEEVKKDAATETEIVEEGEEVETTEEETVETVETAQKKCQKAGASYYGFGFLAALLAVVSL